MSGFKEFYGLKSKFVYYDSLQETHPSVYAAIANKKIEHSVYHNSTMLAIAEKLRAMASVEGAKEVALLQKFFNVTSLHLSPSDMYSKDIGKTIVESINIALQFKATYERMLTRIVGKNGKKHAKITATQFFADYFSNNLLKLVLNKIDSLGDLTDYSARELGEIIFSDEIINQALEAAFFGSEKSLKESGDWSASDKERGYQEFFGAIEKFNKNAFLQEVAKAYKLDDLKERLLESVDSSGQLETKIKSKGAKSYLKKSLKESTTAKGTLGEIIGEKSAAAIVAALQGGGFDASYNSKVIGSAGGKADFVMSFGLDFSKLLDVVDRHYSGREETVDAYKGLNDYLSKMNDGFVVYANAKDYSLIENKGKGKYYFDGFSSGSPMSLGVLEGVIANTPGGSQELIGAIMSTMEGAIWNSEIGALEEELCSKFAYFLFDDVLTIGKDTKASARAIHLMYLDGVYVPLSYMLFLMADAIEDVTQDPRKIFNVSIKPGEIKFKDPPWGPEKWSEQKAIAYEQIQISAKFLAGFREVISDLI